MLIGTIVPGGTIVFIAGVLGGLHALDPWLAAALAIVGAMLGDATSYAIGRRYGGAIRATPLLRRHPGVFARGEAYFAANGRKGIFLGRFLAPLRAVVPLVAGMSTMAVRDFFAIDALAALVWVAAHLVPGVLFGASLQLAGAVSSRLLALIAVLVAGLWLITLVIRVVTQRGWPYLIRLRERLYLRARVGTGPLAHHVLLLLEPARGEPLALLISATLLVAGAWLFLGVVEDVVTRDALVDIDDAIHASLSALRSRWADNVMVTITELASAPVMLAVIGGIGSWFAVTRRYRTLAYWLAAAGFAEVLVLALKYGLERSRPTTAYAAIDAFSFPSGHAAISMVVYGFLAFLLGHGKAVSKQGAFALAATSVAALVAFSRLYLGVHWLSDVIASFGLGIAWIALLGIAYIQRVHEGPIRALPALAIVLATLIFVGGPYAARHHRSDLARFAPSDMRPTLSLDAWRDGQWKELPDARAEFGGEREEPFTVQWAGTRESVTEALHQAGWLTPAAWRSSAALLWLVPSTPIAQLPVLPKFHQGQPPALTLIRPIDSRTRTVIRLWRVANATSNAPDNQHVPIWSGMITTEHAHSQWGLLAVARTDVQLPAPGSILAEAVRGKQSSVARRGSNAPAVLLVQ